MLLTSTSAIASRPGVVATVRARAEKGAGARRRGGAAGGRRGHDAPASAGAWRILWEASRARPALGAAWPRIALRGRAAADAPLRPPSPGAARHRRSHERARCREPCRGEEGERGRGRWRRGAPASPAAARRPPAATHALPHPSPQLRFQRFGRKKAPFYRLVAIDSRDRREGRPLERLGFYDPLRKETSLNAPAIKKWLAVGAQPSQTVANLLKRAMVLDE